MRRRRRNESGFTLVEVLVALTVMTIGVLGMAAFTVTVAQSNRGAANRTRADELLHEKIEELQTEKWETVNTGQDNVTVGDVQFTREWTVTKDDPETDIKRIDLEAAWSEGGVTFQVRSATFLSRE